MSTTLATANAAADAAARCCVVVMAKAPERSKRRLAAALGDRAAVAARHLYACALEDVAGWPGAVCLAVADAAADTVLERPAAREVLSVRQGAGNLGERIEHVSSLLYRGGHRRQIFIGIDCAELDADYLRSAAAALETHDVVLGPARDGGVVLMGTAGPWPPLAALPWSAPALGAALEALCTVRGLRVARLGERADVDTLEDLLDARAALDRDPRPARRRLRDWLAAQPECRPR